MVTQVEQISEAELELERQRKRISEYESQAQTISKEQIPQRKFGSGVTKEQQQSILQRKKSASDYIESLKPVKGQIAEQQSQVTANKQALQRYEEEKAAYQRAESLAARGDSNSVRAAYFSLKRKGYSKAYDYFLDLYSYYKGQKKSKPNPFETPPGTYGVSTPEGVKLVEEPGTIGFSTKEGYKSYRLEEPTITKIEKEYAPGTSFTYGQGVITAAPKPQGLEKVRYNLGTLRETSNNNFLQVGVGLGLSGIGTLQFIKTGVTKPIEIPKGLYQSGKKVVTGEGFPEIGKMIKEETSLSVGFIAGEVIQLKAPTLLVKASDVSRTLKLTKLDKELIIAPEFFKGQKYPQIKSGQTIGELLEEFKPILPGETKPAGFTAAPKPLKVLEVGKSTSEIPGLYQAPKLSATFLRVSGESDVKLFSLNILPTLKPTAIRITPTKFELLPGVATTQKSITPIKEAQEFYKNKAVPGKSYVPFIKTEKEAVIPMGTLLKEKQVKYFFEFEGRKIPIVEFDVTPGKLVKSETKGFKSASDISSSYKTRIKSRGVINPYSYSVLSSSKKSLSSSNALSYSKSIVSNSLSSLSKSLPSSSIKTPSRTSISPPTSISRTPKISYPGKPYKTTYLSIPQTPTPKAPKIFKSRTSQKFGDIKDITTAYRTFVKQGGKVKFLSGYREKGEALRFGEDVATKTLRATFGVQATQQKIQAKQTQYTPSKIFRGFKIEKGKKVRIEDTFIQKKGTRLSNRGEVSEILSAKRRT